MPIVTDYAAIARAMQPEQPQIDFSCHVCGVQCDTAPNPPARAVCPAHCEDHDYEYDPYRSDKFCLHCDAQIGEDYWCD